MLADVAERMPMPTRAEPVHHQRTAWLTPQLGLQLLMLFVAALSSWFLTRSDVRSLNEKTMAMQQSLSSIQSQLPNKEALDLRLEAIERNIAEAEERLTRQETWQQNTRERLAEKGWKP